MGHEVRDERLWIVGFPLGGRASATGDSIRRLERRDPWDKRIGAYAATRFKVDLTIRLVVLLANYQGGQQPDRDHGNHQRHH
ncbi:MAG: hypothetical protein DLM61_09730 [Pseudonocardiales bacterium]|nr:MAG: hypothetical protein DLM61_09730 [Pseudonocardiales bacterium]